MRIDNTVQAAVNKQINLTMSASYSFLAISAWFETTPFKGFAHWMMRQKDREQTNAMKLYRYVKDRIGVVELLPLSQPKKAYKSPLDAYKSALAQLETVTRGLYDVYDLAVKQNDFETQELMYGFVGEQVVQQKNMSDLIGKLEVAGNDPDALLHMDYVQEKEA
jgi:ferritin